MAENPAHARIAFYTAKPDADLDGVLARAKDELVPLMREQPGFRRYTVLRTGPDDIASISGWDSEAQATEAGNRLSGWVRETMGPSLASVENHIATVVTLVEASAAAPVYGRVTNGHFQPGKSEEVRARARAEFLPQLQQQPGFIRHVAFQPGSDRTITFMAFASREELEAAEAATAWWREYVMSLSLSNERHAGEVVWAIRND